ncbi:MAG: PQQ-binding-like beta-propeller repeat protein [Sandaracinus sp.]|nr:PQQ-binding-like beta-propeller repeat protein [Sandaracinus sp.]
MKRRVAWTLATLGTASLGAVAGCGGITTPYDFDVLGVTRGEATPVAGTHLSVRWSKVLRPRLGGPYTPVENAAAAIDMRRQRVFVGSSQGMFFAFDGNDGRELFRYDPEAGVEAEAVVDEAWGDVYLASDDGRIHALSGRTGEARWKAPVGGSVRQTPRLGEDALYVVTEEDRVVAMSRENGEVLWSYQREVDVELAISGHAGLTVSEDGRVLYTAFTDGTIVALDATDGSLKWERPTVLDDEAPDEGDAVRFYDADVTPIEVGEVVYAASFRTGLYALERSSGTVLWREPLAGVVALTAHDNKLLVSSSVYGVVALDRETREVRWRRPLERGAPGQSVVTAGGHVLVAESTGSLLVLELRTGREVGRLDAGRGFGARPSIAGRYGWILSNGGQLFAFEI